MKTDPYSLEHVDAMIDLLETKIEKNELTQKLLAVMQKRLDSIEALHRDHPQVQEYYHRMLELQALIYGESDQEDKALQFMKEAVREAGSVGALYSRLLKQYIETHVMPSMAPAVATVPVEEAAIPAVVESFEVAEPILTEPQPEDSPVAAEPALVGPDAALANPESLATADAHVAYEYEPAPEPERRERRKLGFGKFKIAFIVLFGLVVVGGASAYFVPSRASALPGMLAKYPEIQQAKKTYDRLTAQYDSCSSNLASEKANIDTYNTTAVDTFNQDTLNCKGVLTQQQQAADRYNKLVGLN